MKNIVESIKMSIHEESKEKAYRPSWQEYFMNIAKETAMRSTCLCVKIGAITVKEKRIISTGYVGAPRKTLDCYERGSCLRRELGIPSGHRYELCRSVHAEMNAIINAARSGTSLVGADIYIWGKRIYNGSNKLIDAFPCFICKKLIINAGIKRVFSNTKEGKIKAFDVDEWIKEWREKDMIDDMDIYKTEYGKEKNK